MKELYKGPNIVPYYDFYRLPDITNEALSRTSEYLFEPQNLYPRLLALLAQNLDRSTQMVAVKRLKQGIRDSGHLLGSVSSQEVRDKRNLLREQYIDDLSDVSGHHALERVSGAEITQARYKEGVSGGKVLIRIEDLDQPNFSLLSFAPEIRSLFNINPNLLNPDIITEVLAAYPGATFSRRHVFEQAGYTVFSPEYQIHLLARLGIAVKRHMLSPVLDKIRHFGRQNMVVYFSGEHGKTPLDHKTDVYLGLMGGNSQSPEFESRMGTEFFRGYLDSVYRSADKSFSQLPSETRAQIVNIIQALTFMRTRNRKYGQSGEGLMIQVLEPLHQGKLAEAEQAIKRLIFENRRLWPLPTLELFGLTEAERIEFERLKTEASTAKSEAKRIQKEAEKKKRPPPPDDCDPSLKTKVEALLGQTYRHEDAFGHEQYAFVSLATRISKNKLPIPGYVRVKSNSSLDGSTTNSTTTITYGAALRIAQSWRLMEEDQKLK
ncbi:MAG: hypothetical protein WC686_02780 [Candidatus Shapirobacteria bacterium]|jgi:hypothetical protein